MGMAREAINPDGSQRKRMDQLARAVYGQHDRANPSTTGKSQGLSNWLTPRANEPTEKPGQVAKRLGDRGEHCHGSLSGQVSDLANWPTPAARDTSGISGKGRQERKGNSLDTLPNAVILGPKQWATPQARDFKGAQGRAYKNESSDLPFQAEGKRESNAKLNPDWVCQLMGIPVGWVHPEGVRNRVDELRMLGNGVVPQTAAKAFTTLAGRFHA